MKIQYDPEAGAAYIYLKKIKKGEVKKTLPLNEDINFDLDENNKLLGVEILSIKTKKEVMKEIAKI